MSRDHWQVATLGEFVRLKRGFDLPEHRRRTGSVPVLGSFGVTGSHDEARVAGPGVTVGRSGASMGVVSYTDGDYWPLNTVLYSEDFRGNDSRFAYYLLRTLDFGGFNSGSAQPSLNRNYISAMPLRVPHVAEQRRIAGVLGALDDKIEHNRALSIRLAEAAYTDFERRRAQWSDAGRHGVLGELGCPAMDRVTDSGLPYIGLDVMPQGIPVLGEWSADNAPSGQSSRFARGDILFGKLRPYFKKVGVAPIEGRCSTEILVLRPIEDRYWGPLLGYVLSDRFIAHCVAHSTGTRMPRSEWRNVDAFAVTIPCANDAAECTDFMRSVFELVTALIHESRRLAAIRDALQPKLVSGKIRVPESYDPDEVHGTLAEQATAS
jgi:type I restriction enzyme S subunit